MNSTSKKLNKFKPISKDFEFRQFPFYWIVRSSNLYSQKMEKALKKVDMNITTWRISMILRENGAMSISGISEHAALRLPTITRAVYKMQDTGLVTVNPDKNDARISVVKITKQGLDKTTVIINSTNKIFDSAFDGLNETELKNLNRLLQHIFLNLSDI